MVKKRNVFVTLMCILLFVITISLFSSWAYQWVKYLLSVFFNVNTGSTLLDLFIGLIAMASSIVVFIGTIHLWNMKSSASKFLQYGAIGFLIKNAFDIVSDVNKLSKTVQITSSAITKTALLIGADLFQVAFWVFVLVFFGRTVFKKQLSR